MSTEGQEPSIYTTPTAETDVRSSDNLMAAWVGPKRAHYYANKFERFDSGGSSLSWHWPAFFVTFGWLLYRKMWLLALGYALGLPIVLAIVLAILMMALDEGTATVIYQLAYVVASFIIIPIFANKLYYNHVKAKVRKINETGMSPEQKAMELERKGGTSIIAYFLVLIPVIGILAAIAIPAYQDYTIRAQISEGLSLSGGAKAAVAEFALDREEWPADNAAAGLPAANEISGNYVSSVAVETGVIQITYGNQANTNIAGATLSIAPDASEFPQITWSCYSETIEQVWLPAACRDVE